MSRRPWHRPPHQNRGEGNYHLSATCYEHKPIIGATVERMTEFEIKLLEVAEAHCSTIHAWCVLPNHYHLLAYTTDVDSVLTEFGKLHGRTSFLWNREDLSRGRRVWYSCVDRAIRSDRHFWATMNYVHHNPVHHRYVEGWEHWPFSNARDYLKQIGREEAARIWRDFPVLDYGKGWDDPDM